MKRALIALIFTGLMSPLVPAQALTLTPGDLIKASGPTVYYFHEDGTRLVFPNEKIFFSWYSDFTGVKTITDTELAAIQMAGNVRYRPGVRLVKITTDPRVYAIENNELRWVRNEEVATAIYGSDWAQLVDDLPDSFFADYELGASIAENGEYNPATVREMYTKISDIRRSTGDEPEPPEEEPPLEEPEEPETPQEPLGFSLTITPNKTQAQANETITVTATTDYSGVIERMEVLVNDSQRQTCNEAKSCTTSWLVPVAATKQVYVHTVHLFTRYDGMFTATAETQITSEPHHASIQLTLDRSEMKPGQPASIRSLVLQGLVAARNEIVIDGVSVKACQTTPGDCRYTDYVAGDLGSKHEVYAKVQTPAGLWYRSEIQTLTIAENDTPMISITADKNEIFAHETIDVTTSASDDDGIKFTEISHDGTLLKHCIGAVPCVVTIGPFTGMPPGSIIPFQAIAVDMRGATGTTTGAFVTIK